MTVFFAGIVGKFIIALDGAAAVHHAAGVARGVAEAGGAAVVVLRHFALRCHICRCCGAAAGDCAGGLALHLRNGSATRSST